MNERCANCLGAGRMWLTGNICPICEGTGRDAVSARNEARAELRRARDLLRQVVDAVAYVPGRNGDPFALLADVQLILVGRARHIGDFLEAHHYEPKGGGQR